MVLVRQDRRRSYSVIIHTTADPLAPQGRLKILNVRSRLAGGSNWKGYRQRKPQSKEPLKGPWGGRSSAPVPTRATAPAWVSPQGEMALGPFGPPDCHLSEPRRNQRLAR